MLFIPNIIWSKNKPKDYTTKNENKLLVLLERIGQIATTFFALTCTNLNINGWNSNLFLLIIAFILMIIYELWWIRYFKGNKTLKDFYNNFIGIPLPGATLPVLAFLILSIYGKATLLFISIIILGIGHIGIHYQHKQELEKENQNK